MTEIRLVITGADPLVARLARAVVALRGGGRAVVGTNLDYAKAVHDGSPPHIIRAKPGHALFWPGAAHPVRAVNHPGYKGNPFLTDALAAQRPGVLADIGEAARAVLAGEATSLEPGFIRAGFRVEGTAKARANVKSGTLRRSIHTVVYSR